MTSPLAAAFQAASRDLELEQAAAEQRSIELTERERWARDPVGLLDSGMVWIGSKFTEHGTIGRVQKRRLRQYPAQKETAAAWIDLDHLARTGEVVFRNVVIEKSRQIGETWEFAGLIWWLLQFHVVHGMAMHTVGRMIDDGGGRNTITSLFGRVRFIDRNASRDRMPFLHPLAFRPFSREPAKVENLQTGSVVIGEGQTDNPGRGDTFDFALVDECAFVEHGEQVYAAIDDACPSGKALLSTVNGNGNIHARIATEKPAGWRYLRLHWSQHPLYGKGLHLAGDDAGCPACQGNQAGVRWQPTDPGRAHRYPGKPTSPWYDTAVIGKTDEQVANELDIDRERSKTNRVYPGFQTGLHVVPAGIPYEPAAHIRLELAVDYGLDATSVVVMQDMPTELRVIGLLERGSLFGSSAVPEAVAEALRAYLGKLGVPELLLAHDWTRRIYAIGDPAGHNRTLETGKPFVAAYRRQGFMFGKPPSRLVDRISPSIAAVQLLFDGDPKPVRVCGVNAAAFAEHARENTWRVDPAGRILGLTDDIHNHCMRAFAYYAVAKFPPRDMTVEKHGPTDGDGDPVPDPLERRRARQREGTPLPYGAAL